ncbi:hypothetical protein Mgra_00005273 [Meloidogyne graminicola]|uniref:Uncharacterized protein n=1 Tax=Meloidogyne graminicola TaxID=189291 RepID=A0A8S9ZPW2_9BILA|nr:hypothetical protein Mgra_00005273 [Meloidogyne graminicola]
MLYRNLQIVNTNFTNCPFLNICKLTIFHFYIF